MSSSALAGSTCHDQNGILVYASGGTARAAEAGGRVRPRGGRGERSDHHRGGRGLGRGSAARLEQADGEAEVDAKHENSSHKDRAGRTYYPLEKRTHPPFIVHRHSQADEADGDVPPHGDHLLGATG